MNPRITLIVVAVFAVLLGYVLLVEQNKTPEQLGTPVPTPMLSPIPTHWNSSTSAIPPRRPARAARWILCGSRKVQRTSRARRAAMSLP